MTSLRCGFWFSLIVLLVAGSVRADAPITLRYKFAKGDRTHYRTHTTLKQVTTVMGNKIETTIDQSSLTTRTVEEIDEQGNALLTLKTERLQIKMKAGPAGEFEFDSKSTERDNGSALGQGLVPVYEKLGSAQFQVLVSPRGEIKQVKGYEELLADVVKNNPIGAQFSGGASNEAAKMGSQEAFVILSDGAVSPGDKWEVPTDFELPKLVKGKRKATVTFIGLEKLKERSVAKALVLDETSLDISTETDGAKVTGTFATSLSEGSVLFDVEAGRVASLKTSVTMGGQLTAAVNDMAIPLQIEQTQTLEFELLDKLPE